MRHIPVIVLTGGPCAGKTTILARLEQKLGDLGYTLITVSEAATELIVSGLSPWRMKVVDFQTTLLKYMISKEDYWKVAAGQIDAEKVVIICDRGTLDGRAYVSDSEFELMIGNLGYKIDELSDERYDAVIFLHSVAVDKPEVFTLSNNIARKESIEDACKIDARTLSAWTGHRHLRIIDNSEDIEGKMQKAFQEITGVLGIPVPLEIEKKYKVTGADLSQIPRPMQSVKIVQYYLKPSDVLQADSAVERIRRRSQGGGTTYYHTKKIDYAPGVRTEEEHRITEREYYDYLAKVDPVYGKIEKTRHCFCYKGQYFELDVFDQPRLVLLELELTEEGQQVVLPDFLADKVLDVTGDHEFSNMEIARAIASGAYA